MYLKRKSGMTHTLFAAVFLAIVNAGSFLFAVPVLACPHGTSLSPGPATVCSESVHGVLHVAQWRKHKAHLDAKRFSSRIKRHLGRRYATSRQQFRKHQAMIEWRRRAYKARAKARQFAAARRHVAEHLSRHRYSNAGRRGRQATRVNGNGRQGHALWHHGAFLWRRGARSDAPKPAE
jgi:hypothetical protein